MTAAEPPAAGPPASLVGDVVINRRTVAGYRPLPAEPVGTFEGCLALAHAPDRIVGYVVRRTVEGGRELWQGAQGESRRGYDVEVYDGGPDAGTWDLAHEAMLRYRRGEWSWAKLDALYACGHRD